MRIWHANPERGPDGEWRDNDGGMLIMLRLKDEVKKRFDIILKQELENLEICKSPIDEMLADSLIASARL